MQPKQRDILLIPIPFTDLQSTKRRPVLVISNDTYNNESHDLVVVAITSNLQPRVFGITLEQPDMEEGSLQRTSSIRVDKIYTLSKEIVVKRFGRITSKKYHSVIQAIDDLIQER